MSRHRHFVFFGCRNKEKDWLHRELMTRLQKEEKYEVLANLESRFSMHFRGTKIARYMFST